MKFDSISRLALRSLAATLSIGLTLACGAENKPAPRAAEPPPPPPPAPIVAAKPEPPPPSIVVSKDIQDACGLAEPKAYFAYNSSKLRHQDQPFLKKLADCFAVGPLEKRTMQLVGHTDPRGSTAYNDALGQQRADSFRAAMVNMGLSSSRIAASSRGKRDAAGFDEASWARDRRVEARLAP